MPVALTSWLFNDTRSPEQRRFGRMSRAQRVGIIMFTSIWIGFLISSFAGLVSTIALLTYVLPVH